MTATATTIDAFVGLNRSWVSNMAVEESARTGYTHKVTVNAKDISDLALAQDTPLIAATDEIQMAVFNLAQNEDSDSAVLDAALIVTKPFTSSTAGTVVCDVGDGAGTATLIAAVTLMTTGTGAERGHASYANSSPSLPDDENPIVDVNVGTQGTAAGTIYMNFLNAVSATGLDDLTDGEVTLLLKVRESSVIA